MVRDENNFESTLDIFEDLSFLNNETDSEFLEWYSIEGSNKINELSRQLRSYFNYKSAVIRYRFSDNKREGDIIKDPIKNRETELLSLFSLYIELLKKIGLIDRSVKDKILILIERVKAQPYDFEKDLLREIKQLGDQIWKYLHIISDLEIHNHPQLLQLAIKMANILCAAEDAFFWPFSRFYNELKSNYQQLEKELSEFTQLNEVEQIEVKKKPIKERILE